MATILLSIKPKYVEQIINGTKKYEFRKHLAKKRIDKIIIYSSSPEQHVIGEVEVLGCLAMKVTPLWEYTKNNAGISRENYREYFKGCNNAYAYVLGKAIKYDFPKELKEYGVSHAPQSFVYIEG